MGIPITVNKDENISSVENGTFVFCKELSKGFIKREFVWLGVVETFENIVEAIES